MKTMRWLLAAALLALVAGLAHAETPPGADRAFRVHQIDIGQGHATLVQTLDGKNILMDVGPPNNGERLIGYLKKAGVKKLDAVVISHRHQDHIGALRPLGEALPVESVITPWESSAVPTTALVYMTTLQNSRGGSPQFKTATKGKVFKFGVGVQAKVLWPPKSSSGHKVGDYNEESVLMVIEQRAKPRGRPTRVLVGGDLGWQIERHLARTNPNALRADVVVLNHHGSQGSGDRAYLEAAAGGSTRLIRAIDDPKRHPQESGLAAAIRGDRFAKMSKAELLKVAGERRIEGRSKMTKEQLAEAVRSQHAITVAGTVGRRALSPSSGRSGGLTDRLIESAEQDYAQRGLERPYMLVGVARRNPYHHPDGGRLGMAALLGFRILSTADHGDVVVERRAGADGEWAPFEPSAPRYSHDQVPRLREMPRWQFDRDPENPYDEFARQASYTLTWSRPDPEMPFSQRKKLAGAHPMTVIKKAREGRKKALQEGARELRERTPSAREAFRAPRESWHGAKLVTVPWAHSDPNAWAPPSRTRKPQSSTRVRRQQVNQLKAASKRRPKTTTAKTSDRAGRAGGAQRPARTSGARPRTARSR